MDDFKFQIGSFVRLAMSELQGNSEKRWGNDGHTHNEMRGQIVGRQLDECPGGIQRHYTIRWIRFDGSIVMEFQRHLEIELVASCVFPEKEKDIKDEAGHPA